MASHHARAKRERPAITIEAAKIPDAAAAPGRPPLALIKAGLVHGAEFASMRAAIGRGGAEIAAGDCILVKVRYPPSRPWLDQSMARERYWLVNPAALVDFLKWSVGDAEASG